MRHPDLYVLHGNNNDSSYYNGSFKSMLTTKPETSFTREISARYKISEKIIFESAAYKGSVSDVLNRSNSSGGYNETIDIEQEGLENSFTLIGENQMLNLKRISKVERGVEDLNLGDLNNNTLLVTMAKKIQLLLEIMV